MWRYNEFDESLLRDAVIELESEKTALKRILEARDKDIQKLQSQLRYYRDRSPIYGDINEEPPTQEHLQAVSEIRVVPSLEHKKIHIIGRYLDKDTLGLCFRYYIDTEALQVDPAAKAGILAYLHSKVIKELKEDYSKNLS